jgi:hypothetical protein
MSLTQLRNLGIVANAGIATTKLGAGAIIQVSSIASTASAQTIATATYTDFTSLSLSITPSSASSKILITANIQANLGDNEGFGVRFLRDATNAFTTDINYAIFNASTNAEVYGMAPIVYIDSPSTTSSITYKVQGSSYLGATLVFHTGIKSVFYLMEIAG